MLRNKHIKGSFNKKMNELYKLSYFIALCKSLKLRPNVNCKRRYMRSTVNDCYPIAGCKLSERILIRTPKGSNLIVSFSMCL